MSNSFIQSKTAGKLASLFMISICSLSLFATVYNGRPIGALDILLVAAAFLPLIFKNKVCTILMGTTYLLSGIFICMACFKFQLTGNSGQPIADFIAGYLLGALVITCGILLISSYEKKLAQH